jgi:hypothetical protein
MTMLCFVKNAVKNYSQKIFHIEFHYHTVQNIFSFVNI